MMVCEGRLPVRGQAAVVEVIVVVADQVTVTRCSSSPRVASCLRLALQSYMVPRAPPKSCSMPPTQPSYTTSSNGDYMQTMFKNLMANLRASMATVSPATSAQTMPVQYIVNGLTFGPESSGLTLGELANKLTSAAPFLR